MYIPTNRIEPLERLTLGTNREMTTNLVITLITLVLIVNIRLMHTSFLIKLLLDLLLVAALIVYWIIRLAFARRKDRQAREQQ